MENIRLEYRGETAVLTVDRPKALNALNSATLREMEEALSLLEEKGYDPMAYRYFCLQSQYFFNKCLIIIHKFFHRAVRCSLFFFLRTIFLTRSDYFLIALMLL